MLKQVNAIRALGYEAVELHAKDDLEIGQLPQRYEIRDENGNKVGVTTSKKLVEAINGKKPH